MLGGLSWQRSKKLSVEDVGKSFQANMLAM